MAEAPADPSTGDDLEQKILQVLSDADSPVKIAQLVKKCQVPKKTLNQVLYRLKKEAKVSSVAPATWCLGGDASAEEPPAAPEDPTAQPSLAHSGVRERSTAIIYQQNPVNMICQQGANSHISIANSEAIQIGHRNVMQMQIACDELGPRPPHHLPLPVSEDSSAPGITPGAFGSQHIHMERSLLRRVQLGHGNEMSLQRDPAEHTTYSFTGSPPVSATTADPGTSFNMETPEPGPHAEGDAAQRVHIKSSLMEDAIIGNCNKMTVHSGSKGGVTGSGDSDSEEPEPKEDTDTSSKATPNGNSSHTSSNSILLTSELRAVTLEDSDPQTTKPVLREEVVPDTGSGQTQE
ncbi:Z-DNA-binding protein 1 isoform X3 [Meriones unguiculatus]|uniref:Z-DNA-binding protein 1 isoform X3 n=1 Tax=Meriones unguiculatus TaxID=10047 RepID=UPI00293ED832|nr:Z-DNA-binding protein 1 isoform X3 [Meriones unguiculatus]